jgi:hypothetical protein
MFIKWWTCTNHKKRAYMNSKKSWDDNVFFNIIHAVRSDKTIMSLRSLSVETGYERRKVMTYLCRSGMLSVIKRLFKMRKWTYAVKPRKQRLLDQMSAKALEIGRTPSYIDLGNSADQYLRHFGSLRTPQRLAGLEPNEKGGRTNKKQLHNKTPTQL